MKTYIRPDGEEFIEVEPGLFSLKRELKEFDDSNSIKWKEKTLIEDGFALKEEIEITKLCNETNSENVYYLPSSYPGFKIMVIERPIEGVYCKLIKI
jgi:hypothetical protein